MRSECRLIRFSRRHCVSAGGRLRPPPKYCSYSIFSVRMSRSIWLKSSSMDAMDRESNRPRRGPPPEKGTCDQTRPEAKGGQFEFDGGCRNIQQHKEVQQCGAL